MSLFWIVYIVSVLFLLCLFALDAHYSSTVLHEEVPLKTVVLVVLLCLTPFVNAVAAAICALYSVYYNGKLHGLWHCK